MPLSPDLDTAGVLVRDATLWKAVAKAVYKENVTFSSSFPAKIQVIDFPKNATTEAEKILLEFLAKLQQFLSANVSTLDYNVEWAKTGPVKANLSTYLYTTYPVITSLQQIKLVAKPFYADYAAKNQGRRPFVNPSPLARWNWGMKNISSNATGPALVEKNTFKDWLNTKVITPDSKTCSNSLVLYPGTLAVPKYRNVYLK
jgi:hypothetical protein